MKRLLFESDVIKSIEKGCLRESLNCDPVWHTSDVISAIKDTPTAQPETDKDFEKQIHGMFDCIWDCEIDHPIFQDTVGDLMRAVIECHKTMPRIPTGGWVSSSDGQNGRVECRNCHHVYDWDSQAQYYDFCPNCGADMREGEKE